jgi:hypothetical protein
MSYYGWNGNSKFSFGAARSSLATLIALKREGISYWAVIEMNDSAAATFGEIADYLDRNREMQKAEHLTSTSANNGEV